MATRMWWIIDPSAAHCFYNEPKPDNVDIGRHTRNSVVPGDKFENRKVVDLLVHPKYKGNQGDPDVAIMKLERPSRMTPVKLSKNSNDAKPGTIVTVIGWGKCSMNGSCNEISELKHGDLKMMPQGQCKNQLGGFAPNIEICARDTAKKTADCNGDSGGPIVKRGANAAADIQVGVVSWGPKDCLAGPSAYVKITSQRNWIKKVMKNRWGFTLDQTSIQPPIPPRALCKDSAANACTILKRDDIWVKSRKCERVKIRRACQKTCMQCNADASKSNCCIADWRHSNGSCSNVSCRNTVIGEVDSCRKTWNLLCANQAAKKSCVNLCR